MDPRDTAIRLGAALLIGAVIGFERQWRQRMAGLRTNALVAIGAAGFVVFSASVPGDNNPTRMAAQIVSGIGFLGAGVILREGINIRGLNTAATLWCSAMVGTFAGAGNLVASAIAGGFVVGTNLLLRPIVRLVNRQPLGALEIETHYSVELRCQGQQEAHIRALLLQAAANAGLGLRRLTSENLEDSPQVTVSALLVSASRNDAALEQIIGRMSLEPFFTAAHWQAEQAAAESQGQSSDCRRSRRLRVRPDRLGHTKRGRSSLCVRGSYWISSRGMVKSRPRSFLCQLDQLPHGAALPNRLASFRDLGASVICRPRRG
jgi:putative Mg2+ transporter-C (MgtC) family protein